MKVSESVYVAALTCSAAPAKEARTKPEEMKNIFSRCEYSKEKGWYRGTSRAAMLYQASLYVFGFSLLRLTIPLTLLVSCHLGWQSLIRLASVSRRIESCRFSLLLVIEIYG